MYPVVSHLCNYCNRIWLIQKCLLCNFAYTICPLIHPLVTNLISCNTFITALVFIDKLMIFVITRS